MDDLAKYKVLHLWWRQLEEIKREAEQTSAKVRAAEDKAARANDEAYRCLSAEDRERVKKWLRKINGR